MMTRVTVPDSKVHSAILLRNGYRYVGHTDLAASTIDVLAFDQDANTVRVLRDEIVAIEYFHNQTTLCARCRERQDKALLITPELPA